MMLDKKLQTLCSAKLVNGINQENWFTIAQFATMHNEKRLLSLCTEFFNKNIALQEKLSALVSSHTMAISELVQMHDLLAAMDETTIRQVIYTRLISQITKDNFEKRCEAVTKSDNKHLKDTFKQLAYTFATTNIELINSPEMKAAKKTYKALMTGLAPKL